MDALKNLGQAVSRWQSPFLNARARYSALAAIIVLGALFRVTMCFAGFPYLLNADEMNVVEPAVDMISRGSYLTYVYFHPDHFQVKICAFLFNVYAHVRYGVDAGTLGAIPAFYVIARLFAAVCGIAMIPLAHCLLERLKKGSGVFAAFAVAFYPAYITHSGYASPDVPLSLIILMLIYLGVRYLENGSIKTVVALGIMTAIGMTTKYPAAVCCFYVAGIIIYEGFRTRSAQTIAVRVLVVGAVAFVCLFAISPNLVTDFGTVLATLKNEARTVHLGADGLGFFGNLWFYVCEFFSIPDATYNDTPYTNVEMIFPLVLGLVMLVKSKPRAMVPFLLCPLLWIVLSGFGLHWLRWALPMYVGPLVIVGFGLYVMVAAAVHLLSRRNGPRGINGASKGSRAAGLIGGVVSAAVALVIAANALASSAVLMKTALVPQTRIESTLYCESRGITVNNSAYDGYSPFDLRLVHFARDSFTDPTSLVPVEGEDIEYVVLSSYMYERFKPENPDHADALSFYETVRSECTLVAAWNATEIEQTPFGLFNTIAKIEYLLKPTAECLAGPDITIYRMP